MSKGAPHPPPTYYDALGRLTAMASLAEVEIGLVGQAARTGAEYIDDRTFADRPGSAIRLARSELQHLDHEHAETLRGLLDEFAQLQQVRSRAVHAVLTLDLSRGAGQQWAAKTIRDGIVPLDELVPAMADATARLRKLSSRADQLRATVARSKRTTLTADDTS